jgi:hypothetical protein
VDLGAMDFNSIAMRYYVKSQKSLDIPLESCHQIFKLASLKDAATVTAPKGFSFQDRKDFGDYAVFKFQNTALEDLTPPQPDKRSTWGRAAGSSEQACR